MSWESMKADFYKRTGIKPLQANYQPLDKIIEKPIEKKVLDKVTNRMYNIYKTVTGGETKAIAWGLTARDANILLLTLHTKIQFDSQHCESEITIYKKEQTNETHSDDTDGESQAAPKPRYDDGI